MDRNTTNHHRIDKEQRDIFRHALLLIVGDGIELSHEKVFLQRNHFVNLAKSALKMGDEIEQRYTAAAEKKTYQEPKELSDEF